MKLFLLCFFPGMIQSWRLPPHLFEAAIALVTAQVLNPLFPAESKEMWLKSWSELTTEVNTVVCLSELVAAEERKMEQHR